MIEERLKSAIRDVPDFPKPGIMFKDITPIMLDATLSKELVPANYDREDFIFGKDKLVMPLEMAMKNAQLNNAN